VRYAAGGGRTLAELWNEGELGERIDRVSRVAAALPAWWRGIGTAASPMPADVVLGADGEAILLPAPFRPRFDVAALVEHPGRARYVSADRLRARNVFSEDLDDLHAVGAMLAEIMCELGTPGADEVLLRAANRTLFDHPSVRSALPAWVDRIEAVREVRTLMLRLVKPLREQHPADPLDVASSLARCARNSDAITAIELLRQTGRSREALAVLDEVLLEHDSMELLFEAARLAEAEGLLLEAIQYLERAVALAPNVTDGYAAQLLVIRQLLDTPPPSEQAARHRDLLERVDAIVWRDFGALPAEEQSRYESVASRILVERDRFHQAANFIYPRLRDAHGKHLWWKFDMSLDYAEALMGLSALPQARDALASSKIGLLRVKENKSVAASEVHRIGKRLADLELRLARLQPQPEQAP
jgi:tetratricopeptide (TPR) repeat protein